ncbi:MAG: lactate utilization protein [Alphaproteobacteria bacterium]|nr:lactate utilization protein [Alphaproteobacteria bacterium]
MSASGRNDARAAVMARMREALQSGRDGEAKETVRARLAASAPTLVPARADLDPEARIQLFIDQAKAVQADVERIERFADLPETIADYFRRHNLPMRLVKATDDRLDQADWNGGLLEVRAGPPEADDPVGLSAAFAGIAETGTLMLASDTDHPTTLAFLPETAVIAVPSDRIARAYEDALHAFRQAGQPLPRSINLVTGPSRSGDIEQTLQLGAHGPKRLLVVLVDEASGDAPIADIKASAGHQ